MAGKSTKKHGRSPVKRLTERRDNHAQKSPQSKKPRRSLRITNAAPASIKRRAFDIQSSHLLRPPSFDITKYTVDVWEPDLVNQDIPGQCVHYVSDIYQRFFQAEMNSFPRPYLDHGTPITIEKRAVVVDWLVSIHRRFQCPSDESLYLAVNLFDRYIAETVHDYTNDDVQLVGATCLLLATKFEEIDQPTIKELVKVASRRFSRRNLVDMECEILSQLGFALHVPTGLPFLHRFLFLCKASVAAGEASKYYMKRLLLEHESLGEPPSLLAAACVCLALNHPQIRAHDEDLNTAPGIPLILLQYTGYSPKAIRRVAQYVASVVAAPRYVKSNHQELNAVRHKHSAIASAFDSPDAADIPNAVRTSKTSAGL